MSKVLLAAGTASVILLLTGAPAAWGDEALDRMMEEMDQQRAQPAGRGSHIPSLPALASAMVAKVTSAISSLEARLAGPDLQDLDAAVLEDPDDYSLNSQLWAQARTDARIVQETLSTFPFKHAYTPWGVVGDYMENGLNPMIERVISEDP
jgi:hypothetical protein